MCERQTHHDVLQGPGVARAPLAQAPVVPAMHFAALSFPPFLQYLRISTQLFVLKMRARTDGQGLFLRRVRTALLAAANLSGNPGTGAEELPRLHKHVTGRYMGG